MFPWEAPGGDAKALESTTTSGGEAQAAAGTVEIMQPLCCTPRGDESGVAG